MHERKLPDRRDLLSGQREISVAVSVALSSRRRGLRALNYRPAPRFLRKDDERKPPRSVFRRHGEPSGVARSVRLAVALVLTLALGACGFQLRGAASYPFDTIYVNAAGAPQIASDVKKLVASSSTAKVAEDATKAQVVLDIPIVSDDKEVLSLSSAGAVQEYELIKRITFRLHDNDGNDWLPPAQISVRRSYTFNQSQVLARDAEEQRLWQEMQTDVVHQLIRRLQAAKKPA